MKDTTEYKLLESEFEDMKSEAAKCLLAMGAECPKDVEPATWEGMMAMAEDIQANGKPKHQAAAMFAVAGWVHGCKELKTLKAKQKLEELLESESGAGEQPAAEHPAEEPAKK